MSRLDPIKEARAVQALRESLAAVDAEDDVLLLDSIEGETGLFEAIDMILGRMSENRVMVEGLATVISDLEARKARFAHRIDADRALIEQALMVAELDQKIERPSATIFLSRRAPKVIIEEEGDIPAEFWKAGAPTLDKKALGEALKARADALQAIPDDPEAKALALAALPPAVPGATLSNAAPTLSIRTK